MTQFVSNQNDHDLISAIKGGDHNSFRILVEKYQERVIRICRGYLGSYEDAEDLAQEVFIEVYRSSAKFRGQSEVSTWLYRIAVNRSLNYLRDNRKKFILSKSSNSFDTSAIENRSSDSCADDKITTGEQRRVLHQALNSLSENQKTAFILNKYEDLPYNEISSIMGVSISSVESLLFRAKRNLQKKLVDFFNNNML